MKPAEQSLRQFSSTIIASHRFRKAGKQAVICLVIGQTVCLTKASYNGGQLAGNAGAGETRVAGGRGNALLSSIQFTECQ
jgi:hypothetical protein